MYSISVCFTLFWYASHLWKEFDIEHTSASLSLCPDCCLVKQLLTVYPRVIVILCCCCRVSCQLHELNIQSQTGRLGLHFANKITYNSHRNIYTLSGPLQPLNSSESSPTVIVWKHCQPGCGFSLLQFVHMLAAEFLNGYLVSVLFCLLVVMFSSVDINQVIGWEGCSGVLHCSQETIILCWLLVDQLYSFPVLYIVRW